MTLFTDRAIRSRSAIQTYGKYVAADPNTTDVVYNQASTMTIAANNSSATVTLPTAYSAAPYVFLQNSNSAADATATVFRVARSDTSTTAFTVKANNTATNIVTLSWFAYGVK